MLSEPRDVTLEAMRRLIDAGVTLVPHAACERAMTQLQELLSRAEQWQERAKSTLQAR